jgi:hypothetical protein
MRGDDQNSSYGNIAAAAVGRRWASQRASLVIFLSTTTTVTPVCPFAGIPGDFVYPAQSNGHPILELRPPQFARQRHYRGLRPHD